MTARQHPDSHGDLDFVRVGSWVLDHAAIIRPSEKAAGRGRGMPAKRRRPPLTPPPPLTTAPPAPATGGFPPRLRPCTAAAIPIYPSPPPPTNPGDPLP